MKSKLVRVSDRGTDMIFAVSKFEESDIELLRRTGWELSPELTMITIINERASSSISTFRYPPYDIEERSTVMNYNHTTHGVAATLRTMDFDEIPETLDVRNFEE